MIDPERQAEAAVRAARLREEARYLRAHARTLEAQAASIERTWNLDAGECDEDHT